jgi:uncharacterized membrane protein
METTELKKIWKTLAENKLIDKSLAQENILQLITKKGVGLLEKLSLKIKKEIITDFITSGLVTMIIIGVFIFQNTQPIEKRAHVVLFVILAYFIFKLYNDIRKHKMLKTITLTDSIRNSTLLSYKKFKSQLKQDIIIGSSFIFSVNIYVIYIYYKAFGNINAIDFSKINGQSIGFFILVFLVLFFIFSPFLFNYFFKKRYKLVINDFESTLEELNSENK